MVARVRYVRHSQLSGDVFDWVSAYIDRNVKVRADGSTLKVWEDADMEDFERFIGNGSWIEISQSEAAMRFPKLTHKVEEILRSLPAPDMPAWDYGDAW